jgi:polyketide synthase PksN
VREVLSWQEVGEEGEEPGMGFKEQGVYLITGGLGGLGGVFAQEILRQTEQGRVVLTGRTALSAEKRERLESLSGGSGRVSYRQVDLGDGEAVEGLIAGIVEEYGQLNGILHSAGMIADNFLVKKGEGEFRQVLEPKVTGTYHLDQGSRGVELDFMVLFSSLAGAVGNVGQGDYASANGFMDQFAGYRNRQVAEGQRRGRTRSINWGLWQEGGMGRDAGLRELLQQSTGMEPMATATGMAGFYRSLALPYDQMLVAEGDLGQLRQVLLAGPGVGLAPPAAEAGVEAASDAESLREKTQDYLRQQFSGLLKLPAHKIDAQAGLEQYGIDSILAMKLTNQLEKTFGSLSKTLLFEYQTIARLAGYFVKTYPAIVQEKIGLLHEEPKAKDVDHTAIENRRPTPVIRSKNRFLGSKTGYQKEIAIIGLAGKYPQAENLQEFWRNLQNARDCITEIPSERWDNKLYYDPDQNKLGKSYSKWGGFIADVDKFDPLFFNISPKEAALIDPQERLFLEAAWETIEDAGYNKERLAASRVGVFVGVMWGHYELFGAESILRGETTVSSSSHASIANRVSYFLDFHGPSIAIDTMCSSSLTAIHLACEELRKGEIDAAIAGGVNVTIHPYKYLSLSQGKFVASDGKCRSFGKGGDGYVPGEGVGAVLLKPLENALRDGDQVYAVIKSSTVNHGGKTNGYTVPNPNAQADLILDALKKANIDPRTLSYVETHGTGTSLGDPIEITGLLKAFEGCTQEKQFCPIGSVKSNIGHLESAAGIAAVTKAVLQMRHKQLVPSLHADPLNPNINFEDSPFYVQTKLTEWKHTAAHPRRVGVSSFGAGGSNAHLILEEYADAREPERVSQVMAPEAFVLSARDQGALCRYAEKVVRFLEDGLDASLANMAYTSQVGRTPMDARLVIIASSLDHLKGKLNQWITWQKNKDINAGDNTPELEDVFYGSIREARYSAGKLIEGPAGRAFLEKLLANRDLEKIARLWILGVEIDWSLMYRDASPRRVSLPTYPFDKERCWVSQETPSLRIVQKSTQATKKVAAHERTEEKRRTYYYPQWTLEALAGVEEKRAPIGPILILDASEGLFLKLKAQRENSSGNDLIVLVKPGKSFQEIKPNTYVIDPAREEHFHELVKNLKNKACYPSLVLHHCSEVCNLEVKEQVDQQLNNGVYTLFYLCKALMKEKHQVPLRIMSVFSSHSEVAAPVEAAIGGFFKTLTLENPRYLAKVIDIQTGLERNGELTLSEKASLIWDEVYDKDWTTNEILYRGQVDEDKQRHLRYIRRLVPHALAERKLSALPLRRNGVYLITGGLGALGLIFGKYLAKNFQSKLVLVGRSVPNAKQEERLSELRGYGAEALFLQADVSKLEDMEMVVREAKTQFTRVNGVIHAAGVNRDAFILNKTKEEMEAVLASKVYGAINLDLATSGENLDLFVLFSSVAGVMGNFGQSDYAYGNHFLDCFAESRENLRRAQKRSGRTLSINWPLWEEGGMRISGDDIALLEKQTGICPLPTQDGIRYWEEFLRSDAVQGIALYGTPSKIAAYLAQKTVEVHRNVAAPAEGVDPATLLARTEAYLKALIGKEINLTPDRIGSLDRLESFGIDSVMINRFNANLERDLGALPKTLLYEHETVREVATFLLQEAREALIVLFGFAGAVDESVTARGSEEEAIEVEVSTAEEKDDLGQIAIIGVHVYYPHSANLHEYWENLKRGRDLIDLVPPSRWDYEEFYHPDPKAASEGKIYCKWGGFLDDYDKFDPHFFNISTAEAKIIDPQERLFLESVWAAIEDAGYTRDSLKKRFPKGRSADVGVFVGVTTNSYHLWAPEERSRGNIVCPSALPWSIANRVSYFFDFSGPSMPVDTACSSSLVAVHLACESLKNRGCQVAIAGGVNLYLHPSKYQSLCQGGMLSLDGKCHSYGAGDDGFVPGEGVGTLVLKPLSKAIDHQDHIYAVIRASAFDHSGRSNGYSAPNPNSQASLITHTLKKAHIHPETIGYVEGHGTGTQLGDSIEIAALTQAFQKQTTKKQFCPIGSVKANIGHSESAAGIASLAKVILQLKHRQLAPSICSDEANPHIDFKESPFYLQHGLSEWESPPVHPRRALINSFGAGGVNACAILEEYEEPSSSDDWQEAGPYLFTLSAKNEDRLREYVSRLLIRLRGEPSISLANLCYTLQVGREAMEERLAMVVSEMSELIDRLGDWNQGRSSANIYRGSPGPRRESNRSSKPAKTTMGEQSLIELASMWAAGEEVDWQSFYAGNKPHRIGVPTYPFARERYWVSDCLIPEKRALSNAQLHPLISYNSSTLREVSFTSLLSDTAFYAVDHKVNEDRIFPGAGFLEMACISGNIASEHRVCKIQDIVWLQPLSFRKGPQTLRTLLKPGGDCVEYEISSFDDENETVLHSEGKLAFRDGWAHPAEAEDRIPIQALIARCGTPEDGAAYYNKFRKHGLDYGLSFQTIQEIYVNDSFALSKLKIADHLKGGFAQFILHPAMMDGALQTAAGLVEDLESATPHLPFALDEVDIVRPVPQTCYAYAEFADSRENRAGVRKFNIRLLDESGDVLIKFKSLFVKALAKAQMSPRFPVAA